MNKRKIARWIYNGALVVMTFGASFLWTFAWYVIWVLECNGGKHWWQ